MKLRGFLSWSKPNTAKNDTQLQESQAQEKADAAEPSTDLASVNAPLIVSPDFAKEIMSDLPDQSVKDITSDVNEMALRHVPRLSPKLSVSGKRKRQESDVVEGSSSPNKRITKENVANGNGDKLPATSTNDTIRHEGGSTRPSLEAVQVPPGKLGRRKKQVKQPEIAEHQVRKKSDDVFEYPPSLEEQVENSAEPPTAEAPANTQMAPRGRGRPPRAGAPATKKTTSMKKGQGGKAQNIHVEPGRRTLSEGCKSPETESQDGCGTPIEFSPHKAGPKPPPKASKAKRGDDQKERARSSRSTRFTAAANSPKDANSGADAKKMAPRASIRDNHSRAGAKKANRVRKDYVVVEVGQDPRNQAVRGKHEGEAEQEQEQESERGKDRDSQEFIDRDDGKSSRVDEGEDGLETNEESDSDTDDPIQADESEEKYEGEEELKLFDLDEAWKTVLNEGARSICGPKLPLNQTPKLLTKGIIKELIDKVREARDLYEQLSPFKGLGHDSLGVLNDELRESLDAIEDQIKTLSENNSADEDQKMIRDIFARAIPAMVFLLQSALVSRVYHANEPCNLETLNETVTGLKEIIRLQRMTILLCDKATHWKAKPVPTSKPIKEPTRRHIFPHLRDMRGVFSNVLMELDRKRKMKQNALDYRLRQKELAVFSEQARQQAVKKDEIWHRKIRASREREDQRRRNGKRTLRQIREDEARARMESGQGSGDFNGHIEAKTTWSDAEDLALYFQLEKGYSGRLTCTFMGTYLLRHCCSLIILAAAERYLNILNTPLLQNKLPEHIRERALYFKPTLLEERGVLEWISSIE